SARECARERSAAPHPPCAALRGVARALPEYPAARHRRMTGPGGIMSKEKSECSHIKMPKFAEARAERCEACGAAAPIRGCLTCGHVGCCDSTRGHATAHSKASGHPIIRQLPIRDASFTWCYACTD